MPRLFIKAIFASLLSVAVNAQFNFSFPDCANGPLKSNAVCDTTRSPAERAKALISLFTVDELIANTVNTSPGVPRLGLPGYQWWSEALHGVAAANPGVNFSTSGDFSSATSFPQPILIGAAFDDALVKSIATVISTEARAFNNFGRAGLDFFTPNINPFRDPRWGRGQETPGEDPFHISQYVLNLIQGLQGGIDPKPFLKVAADCKHYAAYDLDHWNGIDRTAFDAVVTTQDLNEFYLPPFQTCVRDAKVASVMCSYNSVNGIPACASSYLLQTILRDYWGFGEERWVTSDCDAVDNIFSTHNFTATYPQAVADALKAGTDVDCGTAYSLHLPDAFNQSLITRPELETALVRQYISLVRLGYFDPPSSQPFRQLGWSDVNVPSAQALAHQAAVEGLVLLKNDGTLPLKRTIKHLAVIGPWANVTTLLQGNYFGKAPFLVNPLQGAIDAGFKVTFAPGTAVKGNTTDGFAAAIDAARQADAVIFAGGNDETVEREGIDRTAIGWPGNQQDLILQLADVGKPFVVLQFGGGQIDDSALKSNSRVNAIVWGGYPGQSGGTAIFDILTGKAAPAGRLPTTQYPASYVDQVPLTDMALRPSATNPGRTYIWYSGTPVYPFGHGLHFTTFSLQWSTSPKTQFPISQLVAAARAASHPDLATLATFSVAVKNTGSVTSDYVALLFLSGSAGPKPAPNKRLVAYTRVHGLKAKSTSQAALKVTLGSIARADANGNLWLHSGDYTVTLDTPGLLTHRFTLVGQSVQLTSFPQNPSATARSMET
ncbi:hypothetical protein HGRIS_014368 [Hohenbuehelia grisea]|uniref:xylan 1,4-beta-xylosidase n=1 Tax=Hohenbuehelia grisea TaxID=104357 RepID=A0ABR3JVC2_9AGAR